MLKLENFEKWNKAFTKTIVIPDWEKVKNHISTTYKRDYSLPQLKYSYQNEKTKSKILKQLINITVFDAKNLEAINNSNTIDEEYSNLFEDADDDESQN